MRFSIIAALLLFAGGTSISAAEGTASLPDGVSLLQKAVANEDHVPFSGSQVTMLWSGEHPTGFITQEYHDGTGRTRVQTLWPQSMRGEFTVDDGTVEWRYDPAKRTACRSADPGPDVEMDDLQLLVS